MRWVRKFLTSDAMQYEISILKRFEVLFSSWNLTAIFDQFPIVSTAVHKHKEEWEC